MTRDRRVVAAFDFDGTLTRTDTLLPFLVRVFGRRAVAVALARVVPTLAIAEGGRSRRDLLKERLLARLCAGLDPVELASAGQAYAEELRPTLVATMVDQVRWHDDQGHELVLVSASLCPYLEPLAVDLGFDEVIAVDFEVGADGRLTGRLTRPNVRAAEKERRLREWLGAEPEVLYAYGDSSGDEHLLAMATHPVPVSRGAHQRLGS